MKKILLSSAAVLMAAISVPTMAQVSSSSSSSSTSSSSTPTQAQLSCVATAVETRDNAVIAARTAFNASVIAALQTRRDALKAALLLTNADDRQTAATAAWKAYATAIAQARAKYQTDVRSAWSVSMTARATCLPDAQKPKDKENDDRDEHRSFSFLKNFFVKEKNGKNIDMHAVGNAKVNVINWKADAATDANLKLDLNY